MHVQKISFSIIIFVTIGKIYIQKDEQWVSVKPGNLEHFQSHSQIASFAISMLYIWNIWYIYLISRVKAKGFCKSLNASLLSTLESAQVVSDYVSDADRFPFPFTLRQFWTYGHFDNNKSQYTWPSGQKIKMAYRDNPIQLVVMRFFLALRSIELRVISVLSRIEQQHGGPWIQQTFMVSIRMNEKLYVLIWPKEAVLKTINSM